MNKHVMSLVCLLSASLAATGCVATQADDDESEEVDTEALALSGTNPAKNVATGLCLDSNTAGNAYTKFCNGGNYQNWMVVPGGIAGSVTLVNQGTGRCLDSNAAGDVYAEPCNGGNYQQWLQLPASSGAVSLKNVSTSKCLDSNASGSLYAMGCNGGNFQLWQ